MNSATSGLIAAMGAIQLNPGDEVLIPPYSMSATAIAPLVYGGIPVFVDIEPEFFTIDPDKVLAKINSRTKAIIAVNLFGHPAYLKQLKKIADTHGLYLIEDNAQAVLGQEDDKIAGTIGHIGIYSLNVHKHIQAGEGGVCVTSDDDLALRMSLIRNHGENVVDWQGISSISNLLGYNFRMSEIHAAIANVQLERIDELVDRCEYIGNRLSEGISSLSGIAPPKTRAGCRHIYFMWSSQIQEDVLGVARSVFCKALRAEGVPIAEGYVKPLYHLPLFKQKIAMGDNGFPFNLNPKISYEASEFPVVEKCHFHSLFQFQPVSWDYTETHIEQIIEAFHLLHQHKDRLSELVEDSA
jgi:perosamine synthetase